MKNGVYPVQGGLFLTPWRIENNIQQTSYILLVHTSSNRKADLRPFSAMNGRVEYRVVAGSAFQDQIKRMGETTEKGLLDLMQLVGQSSAGPAAPVTQPPPPPPPKMTRVGKKPKFPARITVEEDDEDDSDYHAEEDATSIDLMDVSDEDEDEEAEDEQQVEGLYADEEDVDVDEMDVERERMRKNAKKHKVALFTKKRKHEVETATRIANQSIKKTKILPPGDPKKSKPAPVELTSAMIDVKNDPYCAKMLASILSGTSKHICVYCIRGSRVFQYKTAQIMAIPTRIEDCVYKFGTGTNMPSNVAERGVQLPVGMFGDSSGFFDVVATPREGERIRLKAVLMYVSPREGPELRFYFFHDAECNLMRRITTSRKINYAGCILANSKTFDSFVISDALLFLAKGKVRWTPAMVAELEQKKQAVPSSESSVPQKRKREDGEQPVPKRTRIHSFVAQCATSDITVSRQALLSFFSDDPTGLVRFFTQCGKHVQVDVPSVNSFLTDNKCHF